MKDFGELEVWKRAHELNRWVYALVDSYPAVACEGPGAEMREAATAVAANIAQACGACENFGGRWHFNEALGALSSLDYLVFLAYVLSLIPHGCAKFFIRKKIDIEERLCAILREDEAEQERRPASLAMVQ
jgi:four helix bundle protein